MTDIDRKQLRELCEKATPPGPFDEPYYTFFFVTARTAVPALLDEIEAKDARIVEQDEIIGKLSGKVLGFGVVVNKADTRITTLERQLAEARAAAKLLGKLSVYTIEDDNLIVRMSLCGREFLRCQDGSPTAIALLKFEAEKRTILAAAEAQEKEGV